MGSNDPSKKHIMLLAKIIGLQVFAASGMKESSNKLSDAMLKEIISQVFN